jgi:hypothetical protein
MARRELLGRLKDERKYEEYAEARERENVRLDEEEAKRVLRLPQKRREEKAQKIARTIKARELDSKAEEARQQESEAKAKTRELKRESDRLKYAEFKRKEKEEQVQKQLRAMRVCPRGFHWIPQNGGYRCAGGSHWVNDSDLT